MTDPEVLESVPTRPGRGPLLVAVLAMVALIGLLQVWTTQNPPQPPPSQSPPSTPSASTGSSHRVGPGAILIQTAVPGPEDTGNRYFELYRNHQRLDSGWWDFDQNHLDFSFQGTRGEFVIHGAHLVVHEPVRYLDWTWGEGTGDYADAAGSGKAEFIAPNLNRYGVLGRLSGKIRTAAQASPNPSQK